VAGGGICCGGDVCWATDVSKNRLLKAMTRRERVTKVFKMDISSNLKAPLMAEAGILSVKLTY